MPIVTVGAGKYKQNEKKNSRKPATDEKKTRQSSSLRPCAGVYSSSKRAESEQGSVMNWIEIADELQTAGSGEDCCKYEIRVKEEGGHK